MANPFAINTHDQDNPAFPSTPTAPTLPSAPIPATGGNPLAPPMTPQAGAGTGPVAPQPQPTPTVQPDASGGDTGTPWWSWFPQGGIGGMIRQGFGEGPLERQVMREFMANVKSGQPGSAAMLQALQNHMELAADPRAVSNLMAMAKNAMMKLTTQQVNTAGGGRRLETFQEGNPNPIRTEDFPGMVNQGGALAQIDVQSGVNGQPGAIRAEPLGRVGPTEDVHVSRTGKVIAVNKDTGQARLVADFSGADTGQTPLEKNFQFLFKQTGNANLALDIATNAIVVRQDGMGNLIAYNKRTGTSTPITQAEANALSNTGGQGDTDGTAGIDLWQALGSTGPFQATARGIANEVGIVDPNSTMAQGSIMNKQTVENFQQSVIQALANSPRFPTYEQEYIRNSLTDLSGFNVSLPIARARAAALKSYILAQRQAKMTALQQLNGGGGGKAANKQRTDLTSQISVENQILSMMQTVPTTEQFKSGQFPGANTAPQVPPTAGPGRGQQSPYQGPTQGGGPYGTEPPPAALAYLRAHPETAAQFKLKYKVDPQQYLSEQ